MIILIFLFALVTALHYLSLKIQTKHGFYTKTFGKYGFQIHCLITGILWVMMFASFIFADKSNYPNLSVFNYYLFKPIGLLLSLTGVILIFWSGSLLGLKRTWGIRFFDKNYKDTIEKRGPYKFLINPIYDGFFVYFLGKTLVNDSLFYLILSLESFLLLNVFLARFENQEIIEKV